VRIAIGADHGGVILKQALVDALAAAGHDVADHGTHGTASVDYPDVAAVVAGAVAGGDADRGVLVCGSGIGVSIAANKVPGARAALVHDATTARLAREHNDANVLCLGERTTGAVVALDALAAWLGADFAGGRHQGRLDKIADLERAAAAVLATTTGEPA
jgi:ribose 5-phosphate isomerase B